MMNVFIVRPFGKKSVPVKKDGNDVSVEVDFDEVDRSLIGCTVTSVMTREGVVLAGTTDGVVRSEDGGRTWDEASTGLTVRHVRWLAFHPAISDREFADRHPNVAALCRAHERLVLAQGNHEPRDVEVGG